MRSIHILLVEDNEGDVLLTSEMLYDAGISHTISVATDGWEAVLFLEKKDKYANEKNPDLILLDVNLPKMNGHEVLKYIKTSNAIKHIPVIMLTTSSSPRDVTESYENNVNGFITKPVGIPDFLAALRPLKNNWT